MENDPNNSVQDEQFGKNAENLKETSQELSSNKAEESSLKDESKTGGDHLPPEEMDEALPKPKKRVIKKADHLTKEVADEEAPVVANESPVVDKEEIPVVDKKEIPVVANEAPVVDKEEIPVVDKKEIPVVDKKEGELPVAKDNEETEAKNSAKAEEASGESVEPVVEKINYALLSNADLVKILEELVNGSNVNEIAKDVEEIKVQFYKKHKLEVLEKRKKFLASGGLETDFSPGIDEDELKLKDLLNKFKEIKFQLSQVHESEKLENLKKKHEIIEKIKALVHNDESINKTFKDFRDLQMEWHDIGMVPQKYLNSLWETYNYHVEKFYDYIKINKELRDLDLKKNLEAKTAICEKAEALIPETNIVNAFHKLQILHEQWREIGPVSKEERTAIWDRFKEATSTINKSHHHYYQDLKDQQKKNLDAKNLICEKVEEINSGKAEEHVVWMNKTKEILELQKEWKTIGFAPKKDNNKIYSRFRKACDTFFENKRKFYSESMGNQSINLNKKVSLCEKAESLKESEDWKTTADELIALQREWKNIGPVPRKQSDEVWKRFRLACDHFFNRRSEFYANSDKIYENNLKEKEKLIQEINDFVPSKDQKENLAALKSFQKRWAEIGFVPLKSKEEISQKYRETIDAKYDKLDMDDHKKNILKFKNKLENMSHNPRSDSKLRFEREKMMSRLQQLKSDISVWENNIGFFANTKKADAMVKEFQKKIQNAHDNIKLLENKISLLDDTAPDI